MSKRDYSSIFKLKLQEFAFTFFSKDFDSMKRIHNDMGVLIKSYEKETKRENRENKRKIVRESNYKLNSDVIKKEHDKSSRPKKQSFGDHIQKNLQ